MTYDPKTGLYLPQEGMVKLTSFSPFRNGDQCLFVLGRDDGPMEKTASNLLPHVQREVERILGLPAQERQDKVFVLLNAVGAGEYYGRNTRGDYYPEGGLAHDHFKNPEPYPYGFQTFKMFGHPYCHHINKDPERAIGEVLLTTWNPIMHWIELVVAIDRSRAQQFGGQHVVQKIDAGGFPDVSIGAMVLFDECNRCGNKAKSWQDYCTHLKEDMPQGVMYPNGEIPYAINEQPRFFDISFVFRGAFKHTKMLAKYASDMCVGHEEVVPSALNALLVGWTPSMEGPMQKVASDRPSLVKHGAQVKESEIVKQVGPEKTVGQVLRVIDRAEKPLPTEVLDEMARHPLPDSLASAGALGMVLKPKEFQRVVLVGSGHKDLADELDANNETFTPNRYEPFALGSPIKRLLRSLLPSFDDRSGFTAPLKRRVTVIISRGGELPEREKESSEGFFRKLASLYGGYRVSLLSDLERIVDSGLEDPEVARKTIGLSFPDFGRRESSIGGAGKAALFGLFPAMYMRSAGLRQEAMMGKTLSGPDRFLAENPWFATSMMAGALKAALTVASKGAVR